MEIYLVSVTKKNWLIAEKSFATREQADEYAKSIEKEANENGWKIEIEEEVMFY